MGASREAGDGDWILSLRHQTSEVTPWWFPLERMFCLPGYLSAAAGWLVTPCLPSSVCEAVEPFDAALGRCPSAALWLWNEYFCV